MVGERLTMKHRLWRLLPAQSRRLALRRAAGWLAPKADAGAPEKSNGVVVAGELDQATGMGEAARLYQAGCEALNMLRGAVTVKVGGVFNTAELPADAALLLAVNAPSIPLMLARAPRGLLRGRRVIGAWAWELPVLAREWDVGKNYVNEIWACSEFAAGAFETLMPGRVRVVPYPLALVARPRVTASRADFGLPKDAVVTSVIFSLGSSFTRKNPLAAVAAFGQAFGSRADQVLVVKISGEAAFPAAAAAVRAAASAANNIRVFSGSWAPERVEALLAVTDIVLSLHRSEGFGLVPAQAMILGIPVVATGWSGNMQFMDEQSAALVGYGLIPMVDPSGVYGKIPGAMWAEPDIGHAAALLRRLGDDPAWRAELGQRGKAKAVAALNGEALRTALAANA
jgi:glycosyltransferase involved in cell wall biosynthesis